VTLTELAQRLGCRLEGDGRIEVVRVAGIEDAGPGEITFLANSKYASKLPTTRASAVIAGDGVNGAPCPVLRTSEPYLAFAEAVALLSPPRRQAPGISPLAAVDPTAIIGPDVAIGPFVSIGAGARVGAGSSVGSHTVVASGASLGSECVIHSRVTIREDVTIGSRVVIQDGAVVGSDGFGFARRRDGTHQKIPQTGRVVIEDDVEIGANAAIDRPAVGETRIGAGTKIDNLVQVAHGVTLGRNVLLAAQVGVAGSVTIEDDVTLAGQVGVAGHITIGKGVVATAQTGIPNSVDAGAFVSGYPAIPNRDWLRASAIFRKLPELKKLVADLERRIRALEDMP
jgi:UDP-3-O-[3-hydroxymyristoyl] glucosamine N-acyltransferase